MAVIRLLGVLILLPDGRLTPQHFVAFPRQSIPTTKFQIYRTVLLHVTDSCGLPEQSIPLQLEAQEQTQSCSFNVPPFWHFKGHSKKKAIERSGKLWVCLTRKLNLLLTRLLEAWFKIRNCSCSVRLITNRCRDSKAHAWVHVFHVWVSRVCLNENKNAIWRGITLFLVFCRCLLRAFHVKHYLHIKLCCEIRTITLLRLWLDFTSESAFLHIDLRFRFSILSW